MSPQPPPRRRFSRLLVALAITLGVTIGIGLYTFSYAQGLSYFSAEPSSCANCHIMQRQFDSWEASSHHANAGCIDCHLPHAFVDKYLAKAENGWRHSKEFTAQTFAEPIALTLKSRRILQENCVHCHRSLIDPLGETGHAGASPDCLHCHASAGHGERAALGGPLSRKDHNSP